jgi:dUTP pyrophosphatase
VISPFPSVKVRVKRLRDDVDLPCQAHPGDAGFDLCAAEACLLEPRARAKVATGLAFEIPPGHEIQVRPRSGMTLKQGVTVLNAPGTIDAGYRGEVCVILYNASSAPVQIHPGDRIAQAVMARVEMIAWEETAELSDTSRGEGGFGSTGVNGKAPNLL